MKMRVRLLTATAMARPPMTRERHEEEAEDERDPGDLLDL